MRKRLFKLTGAAVGCFLLVGIVMDGAGYRTVEQATAFNILRDNVNLLMTMREVYQRKIAEAGLPISLQTIKLCPGSGVTEMAEKFKLSEHGIVFGNVSDAPRNEINRADPEALADIAYFRDHPDEKNRFSKVGNSGWFGVYQYSRPLWVEARCLACHGEREATYPEVQSHFDRGYGYKEGDLRGVMYARIDGRSVDLMPFVQAKIGTGLLSAAVLFLMLAGFLDRYFISRLRQMKLAVDQVANGNFTLVHRGHDHDEVDHVLKKFNEMTLAISSREALLAEQKRQIESQHQYLQTVIDTINDPLLVINRRFEVQVINAAGRRMAGERYRPGEVNYCYQLFHNGSAPCSQGGFACPLQEVMATGEQVHLTQRHCLINGRSGVFDVDLMPLRDASGQIDGVVESSHDITERVRYEEELQRNQQTMHEIAHLDGLTGLPNRLSFEEALKLALEEGAAVNESVGLIFIDLDGFKDVNDALGHPAGDQLLRIVADRLRSSVRRSDMAFRLAGDEFVVIVRQIGNPEVLPRIANHVLSRLQPTVDLAGNTVFVTASIGVACYPGDAQTVTDLIKAADIAMYHAKGGGKNRISFFCSEMDEQAAARFAMIRDLRLALVRGEFFLEYQPQFQADGKTLRGVEALMRWRSPVHGRVPPDVFIPLLEENGLIQEISDWLIDTALTSLRAWLDQGVPLLVMSVNLTAADFEDPDFEQRVLAALRRHDLPPSLLELEITERIATRNPETATRLIERLRVLGVRVAMDDFGTGYSSLSYLTKLPFDTLKIDKSFVRTLTASEKSRAVVKLIVGLANAMQMDIVAEGVESHAELDLIRDAGCEIVQGYIFGKPQASGEIIALAHKVAALNRPTRHSELTEMAL